MNGMRRKDVAIPATAGTKTKYLVSLSSPGAAGLAAELLPSGIQLRRVVMTDKQKK